MGEWRDIESAPKDGTKFLTREPRYGGGYIHCILTFRGDKLITAWEHDHYEFDDGLEWHPIPE